MDRKVMFKIMKIKFDPWGLSAPALGLNTYIWP